ncbi:CRN-like protein [Plasmopara halstedii]|uniref:CRN-like protein n=1 Tax=Plasmopara halstedii TaxID=4781 RepID=A0A0P1ASG4_PLAHL|nr:CRN-like protein [Plasmopara halstedii]CEG44994.1 CRN-like protein [Plasmopara halstedii]|eukprot:XP_024581363.1 CRN-like protein [Plasmopara halstedii]
MRSGDISEQVKTLPNVEMDSADGIGHLFGDAPTKKAIHVLVVVDREKFESREPETALHLDRKRRWDKLNEVSTRTKKRSFLAPWVWEINNIMPAASQSYSKLLDTSGLVKKQTSLCPSLQVSVRCSMEMFRSQPKKQLRRSVSSEMETLICASAPDKRVWQSEMITAGPCSSTRGCLEVDESVQHCHELCEIVFFEKSGRETRANVYVRTRDSVKLIAGIMYSMLSNDY